MVEFAKDIGFSIDLDTPLPSPNLPPIGTVLPGTQPHGTKTPSKAVLVETVTMAAQQTVSTEAAAHPHCRSPRPAQVLVNEERAGAIGACEVVQEMSWREIGMAQL